MSNHSQVLVWCGVLLGVGATACGSDGGPSTEAVGKLEAAVGPNASVSLVASQDTTVLASKPNQNFGASPALDVNRALVQFSRCTWRPNATTMSAP